MARFAGILCAVLALATSSVAQYNGAEYEAPAAAAAQAEVAAEMSAYIYAPKPTASATSNGAPGVDVLAKKSTTKSSASPTSTASCSYWLDEIKHQGVAAFNSASNYTVYRNVKNYGAVGDGVADDTAAIQAAISDSGRPSIANGQTFTNMPAVVYIPPGTYRLTTAIVDYYYTQIIGNPNCMPTLLADPSFAPPGGSLGLIDGDPYVPPDYNLAVGATNVFFRQVRNIIFDTRQVAASNAITGIHWPTAQATSLQNCVFLLSQAPGTQHQAMLIEGGSAGFMNDIVISGGLLGMNIGNQQYTMRNISVSNAVTGVAVSFDWGWTFQNLNINNCSIGVNITSSGSGWSGDLNVHSFMAIDSTVSNTGIAFMTDWSNTCNNPTVGNTMILENVQLNKVTTAITGRNCSAPANPDIYLEAGQMTILAGKPGGSMTIAGYAQGHTYTPSGPNTVQGTLTPNSRPSSLVNSNGYYYTQSKPQYANVPVSQFVSARDAGAKGNGVHDDTTPLQKALNSSAAAGQILFIDAGTYLVTKTLYIPPGARVVGESYSVIMSSGAYFNNMAKPHPVVQVGVPGDAGHVELSDLIVSTQGNTVGQPGAVLIEWNLNSPTNNPSGAWDVHTRIGGFIGSNFEGNTCPTAPSTAITSSKQINTKCYAAYMSIHITSSARGVYLENNWFWTADHDIDNNDGGNQITVYSGRGMLVENTPGPIWLWGTAVEHHALYQYQFVGASNVFMGQIQTETAYWQPNPNASVPFTLNPQINDPVFPTAPFVASDLPGVQIPNADGWGLRVVNSTLYIYGAGLYSFFNNYSTTCSNQGNGEYCQSRIFSVEGNSNVYLYDLHTVGTHEIITLGGKDVALYSDDLDDFTDNVAVFRSTG